MDGTDNTVPLHSPSFEDYVEIEVRQDLLADEAGQAQMGALLGRLLPLTLNETRPPLPWQERALLIGCPKTTG